jgi:hypothetical protein
MIASHMEGVMRIRKQTKGVRLRQLLASKQPGHQVACCRCVCSSDIDDISMPNSIQTAIALDG